jgi:hypothetical protein
VRVTWPPAGTEYRAGLAGAHISNQAFKMLRSEISRRSFCGDGERNSIVNNARLI